MAQEDKSPYARALKSVEQFSEKHIAVLPEKPGAELLLYLAQVTGEDEHRIARLYDWIIAAGRLDTYRQEATSGNIGFAEE